MESPKRHKSNENEDQDMISNLPDFIIGRILSLLPTKDAVSTSVLSKSWIYKWTFITQLTFQDKEWCSCKEIRKGLFVSFVYRVLLHLNSSSIQSLILIISDEYEPCHVDQWISAVLSRRVKKLCVNSGKKGNLSSHSLMKYQSLELLILNLDSYNIRVPPFAYFPSLTYLHLCGINFIGGTSNDSGNIHLDFPLLRTYNTSNCTWPSSVKSVTLKVPRLKVVSIEDFRRRSPSNDSHTAIKFCAWRLTKFTYNGYLLPDTIVFDLSAVPIIASASIDIVWYQNDEENLPEAVALSSKLLKQFINVKSLEFQRSKKVLPLAKDSVEDLPTFEMLSHLELGKELLQVDQELLNYDHVRDCFLTTLQVVKFLSFDGSEHQLSFAKFVMANAVVLKRMSFIPTLELRNSNLEEVKEKLFSFEKCGSLILEFSTV